MDPERDRAAELRKGLLIQSKHANSATIKTAAPEKSRGTCTANKSTDSGYKTCNSSNEEAAMGTGSESEERDWKEVCERLMPTHSSAEYEKYLDRVDHSDIDDLYCQRYAIQQSTYNRPKIRFIENLVRGFLSPFKDFLSFLKMLQNRIGTFKAVYRTLLNYSMLALTEKDFCGSKTGSITARLQAIIVKFPKVLSFHMAFLELHRVKEDRDSVSRQTATILSEVVVFIIMIFSDFSEFLKIFFEFLTIAKF